LAPGLAAAQPVPDQDTLLLIQFDGSTTADYSFGSPAADARLSTAFPAEGRFGGGVELAAGDRITLTTDVNYYRPQEGTIDFWIKPRWPGNDPTSHSILSCRWDDRRYLNVNTLGGGRLGIAIAAGEGDDWTWRRADADVAQWKPDTWHHVAFAWGGGQLHVYVDGEEDRPGPTDAQMPAKSPETIQIVGCDAVLDAFRISGRMFTADDARDSIRQALRPPYRFVSDLEWTEAEGAWRDGRKLLGDVAIPLILGGSRLFPDGSSHSEGIACRTGASVTVPLQEAFTDFEATVWVCPLSPDGATCSFEVWGDGRELFDSGPLTRQAKPLAIRVPIDGVDELTLRTVDPEASGRPSYGIWGGAAVQLDPSVEVLTISRRLEPAEFDMYRRQQAADDYAFDPPAGASLLVARKFWEDEIDAARRPSRDDLRSTLEAFAAPGEFEPVNFVVYAVESLEGLSVGLTDLHCEDSVIPRDRIDVRLVLRRLMRDLYTLPPERSTVVSRFLLPYQELDVPGGTFREYHMIVHVPEDATPGRYTGTVRIAPANKKAVELTLFVEVLPFRLRPLKDKGYGVYYRFPAEEDQWPRLEVELADVRDHGGNMLKANLGVEYDSAGEAVRPSYDRLERGLALLRKHGFHGPLPVSTGCEHLARLLDYDPVGDHEDRAARDRFCAAVKRAMEGLVELSGKYPEFDLMPTHMDEVFGRDRLDRYIRFTEAVRQVPSLRVYITLHNDPKRGPDAAGRPVRRRAVLQRALHGQLDPRRQHLRRSATPADRVGRRGLDLPQHSRVVLPRGMDPAGQRLLSVDQSASSARAVDVLLVQGQPLRRHRRPPAPRRRLRLRRSPPEGPEPNGAHPALGGVSRGRRRHALPGHAGRPDRRARGRARGRGRRGVARGASRRRHAHPGRPGADRRGKPAVGLAFSGIRRGRLPADSPSGGGAHHPARCTGPVDR
jgi:hypothetical protein